MTKQKDNEKRASLFAQRLAQYPELQDRFEQILSLIENEQGDANTADQAEERAIEEVRKLGQELMQNWAQRKHERTVKDYDSRSGYRRKGKKNSTGKPALE
jgi:hypothetical protein